MELLLKLTPGDEVKTDILPMLYRALESDAQQIQELCLSVLPTFASLIDYPAMKNALLPRIKKLCLNTNYLSVRVNCLLCLGKLLEHLDKWLVLDEIIPFLPQIPSREPAVLMGILGIYKLALSHKKLGITKEVLATKVLPFLIPLCVENGLTLNQFNALISLVKQMISTVETEHKAKLEQLNSIQNESKNMDQVLTCTNESLVPAPAPNNDVDRMFSGLGLDSFSSSDTLKSQSKADAVAPVTPNTGSKSLSLEQKQRIAQQQETAQRLTQQPPTNMISANIQLQKTQQKPVNLTRTLMQYNLNQLTSTRAPNYTNISVFPTSSSGEVTSSMQNKTPYTSFYSNSTSTQHILTQNNAMSISSQPALQFNTGWGNNNSTVTGSLNNKWATSPQNTLKQDWSAFESLLPDQRDNKNNKNNNSNKSMNNGDMMDLLN
ncbi:SCY1-like protein 2 [Eumeta japonica]|uniref:SCY1-like protein 2 n=1 Tax=Eumeta variegata TaxID=151549 RepID=A0A4C1WKX4_EUMVA|nr:SCY1-like protein 2 [Eumeta japonica]